MKRIFTLFISISFYYIANAQGDTLVQWSNVHRLNYTDFLGIQSASLDTGKRDILAEITCRIAYKLKLEGKKFVVKAYAAANLKESWMKVCDSDVLAHEQGHFDITEIFARTFMKTVNDTTITDTHDFLLFLTTTYNRVRNELIAEQAKYDAWTMNAPGKEYYFKWIKEQLEDVNPAAN